MTIIILNQASVSAYHLISWFVSVR